MLLVRTLLCCLLLSAVQLFAASGPALEAGFGRVPLSFEANHGQADQSVRFVGRAEGHVLYLTSSEATLVLRDGKGQSALRMSFPGGRAARVTGEEQLPGKSNFLRGNDPSRWQTNVPTYRSVLYGDVFPGVDVRFHGDRQELEYDIVVAPGAEASSVRLLFSGAKKLSVDAGGNLVLRLPGGRVIRQHRPVVFQDDAGGRRSVAGSYRIVNRRKGSVEVSFALGAYDTARPLVIDPVISFSTYFGGATARFSNQAWAVAVDPFDSSVYIAGDADASDLPVTPGVIQPTYKGSGDVFVAKLDATGSTILFCTYIGGSGGDSPRGIAVDLQGFVHVTGDTRSDDFPAVKPFQAARGGGYDVFLFKLSSDGTQLVYSTYLGGSGDDHVYGIATDPFTGSAVIAGSTASSNFPVKNPAQASSAGGDDIFVTKFDPSGSSLAFSTYYGGTGNETADAITLNVSAFVYVTGRTDTGFPSTPGSFQGNRVCSGDAFVLALTSIGGLRWAGCLGGLAGEEGRGITTDTSGNVYVVGGTTSGGAGFPLVNSLQQPGGVEDAFLTKINGAGTTILFSTLLGGTFADRAQGVALDSFGNIFVTGYTGSPNFPTVNAVQATFNSSGFDEAFITKIKADGSAILWSTYLGGSGSDQARGIAVDASGNAYITGITGSKNFPAVSALQSTLGSGSSNQSFIARIGETPIINSGGVLGGASFAGAITPGAITSLFGQFLVASTQSASSIPLPTTLGGCTVKVNGVPVPLYYVSPTQINFQMPIEAQAGPNTITVTMANLTSATTTLILTAGAPGIFTVDSSGKGQGVVVDPLTGHFAAPIGFKGTLGVPAAKGQFYTIYCAGLGAVNDPPASGKASSANPLSKVLAPVTVQFGNVSVAADFAGLTPGLVGLYQVNVQIPANAPSGDTVNLTITVGGTVSNTVTMAIAP